MTIIREEVIGRQRLILGDSTEVMRSITSVDSIITDPVWPNCPPDLIPGSEDPWGLWDRTCKALPDFKRAAIVMRHDSDPRFLATVPGQYLRAVFLPYVMPGYIGRFLGGDEIAYCFGSPVPSAAGRRVIPGRAPAVQPGGRKANGHPCSRAQVHFDFLTHWWSEPGETVLDPFMGSGTTLLSCERLGRHGIGIEVDPKFFDMACRRLEKAVEQATLFDGPTKSAWKQKVLSI